MPVDYIYLIQSGLVSLLRSMEDGATVEVGLVGRDGFAGLEIVLGSNTSRFQGVVQVGGSALRIRARMLREELARNHVLRNHLLDQAQALLVKISQTAACNSRHTVKQRLARWMLLASDYIGEDVLPVSHELLSTIPESGVRGSRRHWENCGTPGLYAMISVGSRFWRGMAWRRWPASAIGFNWTFGNCSPEGQRRPASAGWDT
jgi:hypothetical protein